MRCFSSALRWRLRLWSALLPGMLALAGCGSVPLASLWQMRALQFEEVDPQALRAALVLPPGLHVQADSARLEVRVERGVRQPDGRVVQDRLEEKLTLEPLTSAADLMPLQDEARPRHALKVWRIAPDGVRRLRALRQQALAWPTGGQRTLTLNVTFEGCRGPGQGAGWPVTSLLRFTPEGPYIALLRQTDLSAMFSSTELAHRFPACAG